MRTFITLYILTATSSSIKAQIDFTCLEFLDSTIRHYQKSGTIHYADKLDDYFINASIKVFSKNNIVRDIQIPATDFIILTNSEMTFIRKSLNELKSFYWPDHLIKNSKRIRSDSLMFFVSLLHKHVLDSVKQLKNINEQNKYLTSQFASFVFSKPIYLRQKNIFLMLFVWYTQGGGFYDLSFFRKDANTWKNWITVYAGAF